MEKNKNAIASVVSKIEGRTTLDVIEIRKILNLEIGEMEYPIFSYLIKKYMYYFNVGKLDGDGGFYSTHDDFKVGLVMNISKFKLRGALNALVERGYIKKERKKIEGSHSRKTVNHFYLNMEILDSVLVESDIRDMDRDDKYKFQQDIRYEKKERKEHPFQPKKQQPTPIITEEKKEKEETRDNNPNEENNKLNKENKMEKMKENEKKEVEINSTQTTTTSTTTTAEDHQKLVNQLWLMILSPFEGKETFELKLNEMGVDKRKVREMVNNDNYREYNDDAMIVFMKEMWDTYGTGIASFTPKKAPAPVQETIKSYKAELNSIDEITMGLNSKYDF